MNKKFLSAILFGALMVTSTGTFVSCKDYDDDIDRIDKELTDIKSQIAALQTKIDAGKYITGVNKTDNGLTFTLSDGTSYDVTNGKDGAQGEKGDGNKLTIDADGQWLIDGEATGWYCAKKGETATVVVPEVGEDGYWYFVNKETGKLEKSKYAAAPVSAVEANGICTLTVINPDGTTTVVKLPTSAAAITEIEFVGYTEANGSFQAFGISDNHYTVSDNTTEWTENYYVSLPYTAKYFENKTEVKWAADEDEGYSEFKFTIPANTTVSAFGGRSLVVRVAPTSADASALELALINSKMDKALVNLGKAAPFTGLVTRATSSANGLWTIPVSGSDNSMKEGDFNNKFTSNGKQIGFALQASQFVSNYDLLFTKADLEQTKINFNALKEVSNITDITKAPLIKLNEDNSFAFTNPSSVYKYQLAFRTVDIKNWGIEFDGLTFKVTKFYDKQTVPAIPVKLYYYDLGNSTMKQTLNYYVRLEKNITDLVTLDAKVHTINPVVSKDNFTQTLDKMYTVLGDETVTWKDQVNSADITVYQVAGNTDGSDKEITSTLNTAGVVLSILDSDNKTAATTASTTPNGVLKKANKIKVDLSQKWPVDKDGKAVFAFNKEYYVKIAFKYLDSSVEGTLNTVKLPFTVGIPALSSFLEKQPGIFNGTNDGMAYIFGKEYNVADNKVIAMQYDLTYGFVKLAEKLQPTTDATATTLKFKTNGYINGDNKNSEGVIAGIATAQDLSKATTPVKVTPGVAAVDATKAILMANGDKNAKVYGQKFVIEVDAAKYVNKYAYSADDMKAQKFTITMKSPIKEGSISAADGTTTISVDATDQQKIVESKFLAKTYSTAGTKYQLFPSAGTKAGSSIYSWIDYTSDGKISITSDDDKVLKVKSIANGTDASGTTKATEGYVVVEPINPSADTKGDIIVKVNDVWGFNISQKITVNIKR